MTRHTLVKLALGTTVAVSLPLLIEEGAKAA